MKRTPKEFHKYSQSYRYKLIKETKETLEYLTQNEYEVTTILVKNKKTFKTVPVIDDRENPVDDSLIQRLELAMVMKDKHNISDAAYKSLTTISDLPTFYAIHEIMQKANVIFTHNENTWARAWHSKKFRRTFED